MNTTILPTTTTKNRTKTRFKSARGATGQLLSWASMNRSLWRRGFLLIGLILACFELSPQARAVCQHGCDTSNNNTFLGNDALINNTTGSFNTANGAFALFGNTTGVENTAYGWYALHDNTTGGYNTAVGSQALRFYTGAGINTAV